MKEIIQKYKNGNIQAETDESGRGGLWDLAMEQAEMLLPEQPSDQDLTKRDELATEIYLSYQELMDEILNIKRL